MGRRVDRPLRRVLLAAGAVVAVLAGCGGGGGHGLGHVHALGVDPADGVLYAASHHGLFRIQAGSEPQRVGNSRQDIMGFFISAPTLQLVDWSIENLIVGVDPTGIVGASSDHGATWTKLGTVEGVPAALATNGPQQVYVVTDRGIYASTDGGRTFSLRQPITPS